MMIDVLVDVQRGDCGKGKVSKCLTETYKYHTVAKYNGGGNAGHAVWLESLQKKFTAHYLTSGLYFPNTKIVIGPGCVINPTEFIKEYTQFDLAFGLAGRVFIHPYAHIIQDTHIENDDRDNKIGSTKKGIGPAYSDKYARTGLRAENCEDLKPFLLNDIDLMEWKEQRILMEGSQGWWLDIDWGKYPYVTSSHIHPAFAFATFGIPLANQGMIFGACKPYETYVGSSENEVFAEPEDIEAIRKVGSEFGETTGRPRKIGYLNLDNLIRAVNQTGVQCLIFNKWDVLEEVEVFNLFYKETSDKPLKFKNSKDMKWFISLILTKYCPSLDEGGIIYSGDKYGKDIADSLP
jgi:adenylosuccinate synthase